MEGEKNKHPLRRRLHGFVFFFLTFGVYTKCFNEEKEIKGTRDDGGRISFSILRVRADDSGVFGGVRVVFFF